MKLSAEYLAIEFEKGQMLKQFYIAQQSNILKRNSQALDNEEAQVDYRLQGVQHAENICQSTKKGNIFYISHNVQRHAELIKFEKINLEWFSNLENELSSYIINKTEFYRFQVIKGKRINVVRWFMTNINQPNAMINYESFAILLNENSEITYYPGQSEEAKEKFVKLLLFVKLSEPELFIIHPNQKIKEDIGFSGKENKLKNESGYDVTLVNTLWNKIITVEGSTVRGHIRIQPYGPGRRFYKPIWIDEFEKGEYTRKS
jgi:hypothetical protein